MHPHLVSTTRGQRYQRTGRRHLEFRLSINFARFRYSRRFFSSATTVSMVTPGTPFSKSFRLQALPSWRHNSLAFFCRISSDIGLASLVKPTDLIVQQVGSGACF